MAALALVGGILIALASMVPAVLTFLAPLGKGPFDPFVPPIVTAVGCVLGGLVAGRKNGLRRFGLGLGLVLTLALFLLRPVTAARLARDIMSALRGTLRPWVLGLLLLIGCGLLLAKPAVAPISDGELQRIESSSDEPPRELVEALNRVNPSLLPPEMRGLVPQVAELHAYDYFAETHMGYVIGGGCLAVLGLLVLLLPAGTGKKG